MSIRFRLIFLPPSFRLFLPSLLWYWFKAKCGLCKQRPGRPEGEVRLAVIWIKDCLSSAASDEPWGRSHLCTWETVDQTHFSSQMHKTAAIMSTLWVMIPQAFVLVFKHPLLCSTAANLLIVCKWNQAVELIVIPIPLLSSYQARSMHLTFNDHVFDFKGIGISI